MTYRIAALLPMKGHSERIPGKNFREFAGKPLFRWMLDTLLSVSEIDVVVINTDATELIAEDPAVASSRVLLRDRPEAIRGDFVSMNRIIEDDITAVEADVYLMTHTTNPLLSADSIRRVIEAYDGPGGGDDFDSLFTVNKIQTRFYRADGSPVNHDPDNLVRTQDLEPWFEENSNLYLFSRDSFAATAARIGRRPQMIETPKLESIDLDNPEDWAIAEAVALHLLRKGTIQ